VGGNSVERRRFSSAEGHSDYLYIIYVDFYIADPSIPQKAESGNCNFSAEKN
jgi:hypothetical protein